ncbi:hypothetical protein [Geodermatophilus sabuli]|uniref:Uncharacterized protein n=1 Tax=Geodermatophilus sabuli TaxID=1564158 RepID=A0A285EBW7_9ACTN|nr:hypothetical protein [Geodermatophilus sabuli]MBB3084108.1 hypothetical protein [Geodermatophilus sabuli]SNX96618.1 hypothetical protein SAMN06893097_104333 [Geodermatophilus sabuli]
MIDLVFQGWFQCRLATDPDPYDEPRGVSGYVHAYAGEPDLDRVLRLQTPPFARAHGPAVGVNVVEVWRDGHEEDDHPLEGARVELLDEPKFEGRNGVIADDGFEPIWPFALRIEQGAFALARRIVPADPEHPFDGLFAGGVEEAPAEIRDATGIGDLAAVWTARVSRLREDVETAAEPHRTAIRERLEFLEGNLAAPGGGASRFFGARLRYSYELASTPVVQDPDGWFGTSIVAAGPWRVEFWLGGWDADVMCGFTRGQLRLPTADDAAERRSGAGVRVTDRRP